MRYKKRTVLLFLLPGLLGVMLFYVAPLLGGMYYSLTDGSRLNRYVGFQNYAAVWSNQMFQLGLKNTWIFSGICTPLCFFLSLVIALMLSSIQKGGVFVRNALFMPYLMPSSAILIIWLTAFDFGGVINRIICALGGSRVYWLEGSTLRIPIILLYLWKNVGFCSIILTSAIQTVPKPYYEFALLEGAGRMTMHRKITLPCILPTAYLVFVFSFMGAFKIFKEVYFIGGAYPDQAVYTLQNYMNNMYAKLNYQYVTAAAYIFALMVIALFLIIYLVQRRVSAYEN